MKKVFFLFILVISICFFAELSLRLLGYNPHRLNYSTPIQSEPKFCIVPRTGLGLGLNPGLYSVVINDSLKYRATHTRDSCRITFHDEKTSKPLIILLGCSYTYGMGLNDSKTYPYLIDSICNDYKIQNFSCPGYSTLQSFLLLKRILSDNESRKPVIVVYNYLSFHDMRNTFNSTYRTAYLDGYYGMLKKEGADFEKKFREIKFPYVNSENINQIEYLGINDMAKREFPLIRKSAISNVINQFLIKNNNSKLSEENISKSIINEMKIICNSNQVCFFVSFMENNNEKKLVDEFCQKNLIETIDLSIDFSDKNNFNFPYDPFHPNEKANLKISEKFISWISKNDIKI